MKQKSLISAILLIICVMANSQDKTYMNVQVGENEYKSFEVTPDLKVTWDSEKQETEVSKPAVSNGSATGIAEMKATLTGKITDDGNGEITECGFYWGTTDNPSFKVSCDAASDTLVYTLKGLKGNVKYYYRTFARNSKGETCGQVQNFTTKSLTASSPAGTIGILDGIEAIVVDLPEVKKGAKIGGDNCYTTTEALPALKCAIATMNIGSTSVDETPYSYGTHFTFSEVQRLDVTEYATSKGKWYIPTPDHLARLCSLSGYTPVSHKGCYWTFTNDGIETRLFIPVSGYYKPDNNLNSATGDYAQAFVYTNTSASSGTVWIMNFRVGNTDSTTSTQPKLVGPGATSDKYTYSIRLFHNLK